MMLPIQATQGGPYKDIPGFNINGELSSWKAFWSIPRKLPDEPPEAAILHLANTLSKNPALLQVCNTNDPVVLNSVRSCASGRFRQPGETT